MRIAPSTLALAAVVAILATPASAEQEVVVSIQIQGNTITPDEEVVRESGLSLGDTLSDATLAEALHRLQSAKRFEGVEVLKRHASITDPSRIVVLIRVDEGPVRIVLDPPGVGGTGGPTTQPPRVERRGKFNTMFVPILDSEDGYGLTYGARLALTGHQNMTTRVIFPVSWGGDKRAGVEFQKEFTSRIAPRLRAGTFIQRRTHPFFKSDADRKQGWGRGEWRVLKPLYVGTTVAWQKASLLDRDDTTRSAGADFVLDTRIDSVLPQNAVYVKAGAERIRFREMSSTRTQIDANGYVGLYRGSVLALRVLREDASGPMPPYFKSTLGGAGNLRGFRAGTAIGDTLVTGSAELRVPLTSPLRLARFGTSVFMDAGTTYDKGQRFEDQKLKRGVGAGIWATAALFQLSFMVARGLGATTRVHFGAGVTF